ncbi:MAG: PorV/PorQ family protein [Elusimicrobiota bacterium]
MVQDLKERTYRFSLEIIDLMKKLPKTQESKIISNQILRSGMSIGANIEEAFSGLTKKDYVHSINISRKEAFETRYWLRLLLGANLIKKEEIKHLLGELEELINIFTSIVKKSHIMAKAMSLILILISTPILTSIFFLISIPTLTSNFLYAGPGTDPSSFLCFGTSGRSLALGGAYSGIAEDATAVYYNSGALGLIHQKEVIASFSNLWMGANYSFAGYVHPIYGKGAVGMNFVRLYSGSAEGRDENNNPTSSFDNSKTAINIGFGKNITRYFSLGLNGKFINSTLGSSNISFFALDFGGYLKINHAISVGASFQNAIPFSIGNTDDRLPLNLKVGAGYKVFGDVLLFAVDLNKNASYRSGLIDFYSFGLEATPFKPLSFRLGKNDQELTAGFGLRIGSQRGVLGLDYAVAVHNYLGVSHRTSLGLRFGKTSLEIEKEIQQKPGADLYKLSVSTPSEIRPEITSVETPQPGSEEDIIRRQMEEKFRELYQSATDDYKRGMFIYSLNKFQQARELFPEDTLVKQYIERLKIITAILPQYVSSSRVGELTRRGVSYYIEGDGENAVKTISYALSLEPENFTLERLLNQLQEKTGFKSEKATPTTKISVVDQKLYECLVSFKKKDYWKVISLCEEILLLEPKNVIALKRMGSAFYALGEKKMALEMWSKALAQQPDAKLEKLIKKIKSERTAK